MFLTMPKRAAVCHRGMYATKSMRLLFAGRPTRLKWAPSDELSDGNVWATRWFENAGLISKSGSLLWHVRCDFPGPEFRSRLAKNILRQILPRMAFISTQIALVESVSIVKQFIAVYCWNRAEKEEKRKKIAKNDQRPQKRQSAPVTAAKLKKKKKKKEKQKWNSSNHRFESLTYGWHATAF